MTLENILNRIVVIGSQLPHTSDGRGLLHAYVACLKFNDLCTAIPLLLAESADIRLALRRRLLRLLGDKPTVEQRDRLKMLVEETCILSDANIALRQTVDALHGALIRHLPIATQHLVLQRWINRGTRGAMARWRDG